MSLIDQQKETTSAVECHRTHYVQGLLHVEGPLGWDRDLAARRRVSTLVSQNRLFTGTIQQNTGLYNSIMLGQSMLLLERDVLVSEEHDTSLWSGGQYSSS